MSRLVESLKIMDGTVHNVPFHNRRLNMSRRELFGCSNDIDLGNVIAVTPGCRTGLFKCRVLYRETIEKIEILPYKRRKIEFLKLVCCDNVDYSYKYEDKSMILDLLKRREGCDDILIVKNGFLTDTSSANIVFFEGDRMVTPSTPLLSGTARQRMLEDGILAEEPLRPEDLGRFQKAALINAMCGIDDQVVDSINILR
jgi:4-amino-4-deoxychorismate lyase